MRADGCLIYSRSHECREEESEFKEIEFIGLCD